MFNPESLQIKNRNAKERESESRAICLISSITNDGLRRAALDCWDKNATFPITNRPHVCDVALSQNFNIVHDSLLNSVLNRPGLL